MRGYSEQMQRIVDEYIRAGGSWPSTAHDIAVWAIDHNKWAANPTAMINRCAEDLARAMREETITDRQGRKVRAKHVARIQKDGETIVSESSDHNLVANFVSQLHGRGLTCFCAFLNKEKAKENA